MSQQVRSFAPRPGGGGGDVDRGRKLLSVLQLAGGGAIVFASVVGLLAAAVGHQTSDEVDLVAGAIGGLTTFALLSYVFHIFDRSRAER